jgi:hypothetical protein
MTYHSSPTFGPTSNYLQSFPVLPGHLIPTDFTITWQGAVLMFLRCNRIAYGILQESLLSVS